MPKKRMTGTVVSNLMQKTIVVQVERAFKDPLTNKMLKKYKKFKAHDETNRAAIGDIVEIIECRPLSKDKHFELSKIIKTDVLSDTLIKEEESPDLIIERGEQE